MPKSTHPLFGLLVLGFLWTTLELVRLARLGLLQLVDNCVHNCRRGGVRFWCTFDASLPFPG
jgi:hypothetical protein